MANHTEEKQAMEAVGQRHAGSLLFCVMTSKASATINEVEGRTDSVSISQIRDASSSVLAFSCMNMC